MGRLRAHLMFGAGTAVAVCALLSVLNAAHSEPAVPVRQGEIWLVTTTGAKQVRKAVDAPASETSKKAEAPKADPSKSAAPQPPTAKVAPATTPAAPDKGADKSKAQFPTTVPEAKATAEAMPEQWPEADVAAARARCTQILQGVQAVAMPEDPVKNGICGTPAPVRLISVGKNPEVALSPPPLINCDMVAAVAGWVKDDLQPLTRKHLGSDVLTIEVMSDYSCRAAYGRKGHGWSEHAFANALDIRGFFTNKGQSAYVLEDWGKPEREILEEIAAAKARAEKLVKEKTDAAAAVAVANAKSGSPDPKVATNPAPMASDAQAPATAPDLGVKSTLAEGISKFAKSLPGGLAEQSGKAAFEAGPDKLGGPKFDVNLNINTGRVATPKAEFLHAVHQTACQRFGTTLGPESNAAHRNHLHVDLAPRKSSKFCE